MMNWAEVRAINSDLTKPLNKVIDEGIEGLQEVVDSIYIDEHHIEHTNQRGRIINNYEYNPNAEWYCDPLKKVTGMYRIIPVYHEDELYLFDTSYDSDLSAENSYFYVYKYDGKDNFEKFKCYQPINTNFNYSYIRIIQCGDDVYFLGTDSTAATSEIKYFYKFDWNKMEFRQSLTTPPIHLYRNQVVVLNNEIHVISSLYSSSSYADARKHYKWTGTEWIEVSTLPVDPGTSYNFFAVVYKNILYLIGGNTINSNNRKVYQFVPGESATTSQWIVNEDMTLPIDMNGWNTQWIVYKDKLYLTSKISDYKIFVWDGETWGYNSPRFYNQEKNNSTTYIDNSASYPAVYNDILYFFNVSNNHTGNNRIITTDGETINWYRQKMELTSKEFKVAGTNDLIPMELGTSVIKKIQMGVTGVPNNAWTEVQIDPVNPNKSIVFTPYAYNLGGGSYTTAQYIRYDIVGDKLKLYGQTTAGSAYSWVLVEFY